MAFFLGFSKEIFSNPALLTLSKFLKARSVTLSIFLFIHPTKIERFFIDQSWIFSSVILSKVLEVFFSQYKFGRIGFFFTKVFFNHLPTLTTTMSLLKLAFSQESNVNNAIRVLCYVLWSGFILISLAPTTLIPPTSYLNLYVKPRLSYIGILA